LNDFSDDILVAASQKGNKNAYSLLVERHYRYVFALCLGMVGNVHDAEDIAQDSMLKGFLRIRNLRSSERFEHWVFRIARNLCIDFIRRKKRKKSFQAEQPSRDLQKKASNNDLQEAIRRLPQELRLPLVMYYFDNKNAENIAKKLKISHSGACQRIRAARKQLHKLLVEGVYNE